MTDPITLITGADDRYAMPLAVTLFSVVDHLSLGAQIEIHVIDGGVTDASKQRVERVLQRPGVTVTVHWVRPAEGSLSGLPSLGHLGQSTYLRLAAPNLVSAPKAVYLDSDVVVEGDLQALWNTSLNGRPVAAVPDAGCATVRDGVPRWQGQGLDPERPYYNAGVLLLDLDQWRARELGAQVLLNLRAHGAAYRFADQDGLNAVLQGEWRPLAPVWNVQVARLRDPSLLSGAQVLHYTGAKKPWLLQSVRPSLRSRAYGRFFRALQRSRWLTRPDYFRLRARLGVRAVQSLPLRVGRAVWPPDVPETAAPA